VEPALALWLRKIINYEKHLIEPNTLPTDEKCQQIKTREFIRGTFHPLAK
jgi:hypothetical protein